MDEKKRIKIRVACLCFLIILLGLIFIWAVINRIFFTSGSLNLFNTKSDIAVRGDIFSDDDYTLATSQELYKVSLNPRFIDPNKKEFFIRLFSIYSGIPVQEIAQKLNRSGNVTLSYSIIPSVAQSLKRLNSKLLSYDVFREYEDENGQFHQKAGLSVEASGISRLYYYKDALEPVLGYVQKREKGALTTPTGIKGIERYKNKSLEPKYDGIIRGKRDIGFNVIYDKNVFVQTRQNGNDIYLSINLRLQKKIEKILDDFNQQYGAKEIVAGVMNPRDGSILVLATTNRFDPKNITSNEFLDASVSEKSFEPGSTIKPIVFSLLLEKKLINPLEPINLNKGEYKLEKFTIRDDTYPKPNSVVQDVLIRSSNVGMVKLSKKLSGQEFFDGLRSFGFSESTGIELPYEKIGVIPNAQKLSREIYKATASYGYGLSATFIQLLRAYGVFCNDGVLVMPHLIKKEVTSDGEEVLVERKARRTISALTARKIQEILIKTVEEGTGRRARVEGLIVGGKTGTARIVKKTGGYDNLYNGSFFGFAKSEKQTYIIGVVAFGSHGKEDYYGSQTAAPVFKKIVEAMQSQDFFK